MKPPVPVVAFAPVDQTFLSGDNSRVIATAGERFAREGVTVILCSSMTRAELEMCQQELGFVRPFICESGAAVVVPRGCFPFDVPCDRRLTGYHVIEFGRPYAEVVSVLHRVASRLGIEIAGFSDMSIEEVATECGLSLSHARLAKLRDYDEPFRVLDRTAEPSDRLWKALRSVRLHCTCRGRYAHAGAAVDVSTGIGVVKSLYRRVFGRFVTVDLAGAPHPGLYSLQPASERGQSRAVWIETIIEAAGRAREPHQPAALLR
jgi:mannosyl-3-phosphoglycerate phosphatase